MDVSSYVLARSIPAGPIRLAQILRRLARSAEARFELAELNDFLAGLSAPEFGDAVSNADLRGLSPFLMNYVAAMVEQASHMRDLAAPAWAAGVAPLDEPYFATNMSSLRPHLLQSSPIPFRRRNLFVDSTIGDRV